MRITKNLMLLTLVVLLSSCAQKIHVQYQAASKNTGTITLQPTKAIESSFVTIDDNLIVSNKFAKSVTISNVPDGEYLINYSSDNWAYKNKLDMQIKVEMKDGKHITKLINTPKYSDAWWALQIGSTVLSLAIIILL